MSVYKLTYKQETIENDIEGLQEAIQLQNEYSQMTSLWLTIEPATATSTERVA